MAKKKTAVAYYSPTSSILPSSIVEEKISEAPQYPDSGIEYKGKYKKEVSKGIYELKSQQTRFYAMTATAAGLTIFTRPNKSNTRFFCSMIVIFSYSRGAFGPTVYDMVTDCVSGISNPRIVNWALAASERTILEFKDSPRLFEGDIGLWMGSFGGGVEHLSVYMIGWEEQR